MRICYGEEKYRNFTIKIYAVNEPEDPRGLDNLGTMICFHNRYILGDTNNTYRSENYSSWEEMKKAIIKNEDPVTIFPMYMMDHSGLSIQTPPFEGIYGRFDSGQIGFIFVSKDRVRKEFNIKRITQKMYEKVRKLLKNEVETYNHYIEGNVFKYDIHDKNGEIISEHSGDFYGSDFKKSGLLQSAKEDIDNILKNEKKNITVER